MLSERIEALYTVLQCNNTVIARYAGCSPGNISRLKSGSRKPDPGSRTVRRFAEGVYSYADDENMLSELRSLCGAQDTVREKMLPALTEWLFETGSITLPTHRVLPKSKQIRSLQKRKFAEKLDQAMNLLDLSNRKLASRLNVDVSLISRYRRGIHSPHGNLSLSEKLADELLYQAKKTGRQSDLASCCSVKEEEINVPVIMEWLYAVPKDDRTALAKALLRSLSDLPSISGLLSEVPETVISAEDSLYWGNDGLQNAVVRFLSEASQNGGEMILYSDEPMDWMSGDPEYFSLWASLMLRCVSRGVKIRIIHNVNRDLREMIDAIRGWYPLYVSGMIEPYVFSGAGNTRFYHTVFLHENRACIRGFFPVNGGRARWYDYITEPIRLHAVKKESEAMLSAASPFLKVYTSAGENRFLGFFHGNGGISSCLLNSLPVVTMPEALLERMLSRAEIPEEERAARFDQYRAAIRQFSETIERKGLHMLLCLAGQNGARQKTVRPAFFLSDIVLHYEPGDFEEHIDAVMNLVRTRPDFHLTLLPETPFPEIQLLTMENAVAVIPLHESRAALVFLNSLLTQSTRDYLDILEKRYAEDRRVVLEKLRALKDSMRTQRS